ncbi:MAG TPA: zinc ABC transporter substrate-binding protein [Chthoniobacteraceae bacterium]|nr:zinc ABC transporter substrate-binding protein [Chthoniobacteraceae bacterium]
MRTLVCALLATLPLAAAEPIRVSSFSTVLTEIAQQVGGPRVAVTGHVKPGVDPHEFEPKPGDIKTVADAQLILLSAKHMEGYVGKLKEATGARGRLVEVGNEFSSLKMPDEKDPSRTVEDPHWWHSVANVEKAAKIVRDELIELSPADKELFTDNAAKYLARLETLQKWAKAKIAELPRDQRKLVTSHDAFQYFAHENGFTIYAIEGISSADQPSSKKVGDIIAAIRSQHVKAIFPESIENPKVLTEITRETGVKVAGNLYADGLGEGNASTYEGMYKHNISTIVEALK